MSTEIHSPKTAKSIHQTKSPNITSTDSDFLEATQEFFGIKGGGRRMPVLITLDGRRVSERFVLLKRRNILGRDIRADIKVADGEISRKHCFLDWENHEAEHEEPVCFLEDNQSTNGTYLNGKLLKRPVQLADGDLIRVGKTILGFFLKDERVLHLDQLLLNMALHDSLTGLYKREYFFSELHREFDRSRRHKRPLVVALIDIDHFKEVNDTFGHLKGDLVLRQFSDLLRLSLREGDICGRYGGEEFVVVFPETGIDGALQAIERFRENVARHDMDLGDGETTRITTSCGIAALSSGHHDKMKLLDAADKALLNAKRDGRNRTIVAKDILADEITNG